MIRDGRVPTIYGDGLQTRDFSYVDNAIEGVMKAAVAPDAPGGVYNIANGSRISLLDLVARINEFFGKSIVPTLSAPRPGDILHSFGDIEAARRDLGYTAAVNFGDGLNRTAQWYTEAGQ
ncbi:MAG: UDP-glucose 4-epimerase [Myxococcota bacterium]|jgi:UDP-glucose 4-epimerase